MHDEPWQPKPFSDDLYDECDPTAKLMAAEFLTSYYGFRLKAPVPSQPDGLAKYDLIFLRHERWFRSEELWVEAEQKRLKNWSAHGRWEGFGTVHVPYRKKRNRSDLYIMFNAHWDTLLMGNMQMCQEADAIGCECEVEGDMIPDAFFDCSVAGFRFFTKWQRSQWTEITAYGDDVTDDCPSTYRYQHLTPFIYGLS